MMTATPAPTRLLDYRPPAWLIEKVHLTFRLSPGATRVLSHIRFLPNPARAGAQDLWLDGEDLHLIRASVDGRALAGLVPGKSGLLVPADRLNGRAFTWEAEVEINPAANTALEGLYRSGGLYCTQCEAEGFRKITFYPDRPDVMAPFEVRIESDLPVLLSNGNLAASGPGWAEWHDPWPKPAYLFALVAGDLVAHSGRFKTIERCDVALNIWVRPGDEHKCAYAMDALKRAMQWDEKVYGRPYDLDIFNIVAVDDFNMGAMENKGLNIFNSRYVLASPETATDGDYERIEGIIAHEYFHNWTGNRITCRDWFQLCLKEGLTVFRDQQFSGDMRSRAVKRIDDVLTLRARQFREDNGPLSHPVRPESYIEINNFYTGTIYEKGAEVIGMLKSLVGDAAYATALDLYFTRHDGDAATIEDWLKVFEDSTGRDLSQFKRWYSQAGTPRLNFTEDFNNGTYTINFTQYTPPTPGQDHKAPLVIPIAIGLLNPNGDEVLATQILEMTESAQSFSFAGLASRPVPSLLRGFSAPVILERKMTPQERAFLLTHDTDPFNKWEAGRALAKDVLLEMVTASAAPDKAYLQAMDRLLSDSALDPAFKALALRLPSEDDLAQAQFEAGTVADPAAIHGARKSLARALGAHLSPQLSAIYGSTHQPGPYQPDAVAAGARALRLACLDLLTRTEGTERARRQFSEADNMTELQGALVCLLQAGEGEAELATLYRKWAGDRLVIDKWFSLQIQYSTPEKTADSFRTLTAHPDFDWKNPNRFRSVVGALAANAAGFHDPSGASYRLLADWLIRLDPVNPQTAARMSTAFETLRRYDAQRQQLIRGELARIKATPGLSRDLGEMVGRMLQ